MAQKTKSLLIVVMAAAAVMAAGAGAALYLRGLLDRDDTDQTRISKTLRLGVEQLNAKAPAPVADLEFFDAEGNRHTLAEWRGKTVLLNLWAPWCAPCKTEMPALDRLQAKLGGDKFAVIALNIDGKNAPAAATFLASQGIKMLPLYSDRAGGVSAKLKAEGLPTSLVLNGQGLEIARVLGPLEWDSAATIGKLQALMAR